MQLASCRITPQLLAATFNLLQASNLRLFDAKNRATQLQLELEIVYPTDRTRWGGIDAGEAGINCLNCNPDLQVDNKLLAFKVCDRQVTLKAIQISLSAEPRADIVGASREKQP